MFINDASTDNSWEEIKALKKTAFPEHVKAINLATNIGQHQAIFTAFAYCSGEWTITIDDDLQHSPEDILQLWKKQQEGAYDLVYGMYEDGKKHAAWRNAGSKMVNRFFQKNAHTKGFGSPFRLIHKSVLDRLLKQSHQ
jgi:undecaprenyl-phosphate 4-deoxy-4-formamido-L-arabinose transferase